MLFSILRSVTDEKPLVSRSNDPKSEFVGCPAAAVDAKKNKSIKTDTEQFKDALLLPPTPFLDFNVNVLYISCQ